MLSICVAPGVFLKTLIGEDIPLCLGTLLCWSASVELDVLDAYIRVSNPFFVERGLATDVYRIYR